MEKKNVALIGGALLAAGTIAAGIKVIIDSIKTIPKGVDAVTHFDINKYMGKWYEIARIDYMFEKHICNATAEYSLNDDGSVTVVNRGYDYKKEKMVESEGKAVFVDSPEEAKLKVSFFGPFYAGYNVIAIDPDYKYAMVAGKNRNYLWLLSREPSMPSEIIECYLGLAEASGYDTSKLIWTNQDVPEMLMGQIDIYI